MFISNLGGDKNMGKIIQFRLPDRTAGGYVGFETPVRRESDPSQPIDTINWHTRTFDSRQAKSWELDPPKRLPEEPIAISVMPEQAFPIGHQDFRPVLQRDGLILLGWSRWEEVRADGPRYVVHWLSVCNGRRYATHFLTGIELETANPQQRGKYLLEMIKWDDRIEADYIYFVAPERLHKEETPGFIERLKTAGVMVDFTFHYSMDRIKKIQFAEQYLELLKPMQEERQM
jgi:hypothetical protein